MLGSVLIAPLEYTRAVPDSLGSASSADTWHGLSRGPSIVVFFGTADSAVGHTLGQIMT